MVMKRIISLLLVLGFSLVLFGCYERDIKSSLEKDTVPFEKNDNMEIEFNICLINDTEKSFVMESRYAIRTPLHPKIKLEFFMFHGDSVPLWSHYDEIVVIQVLPGQKKEYHSSLKISNLKDTKFINFIQNVEYSSFYFVFYDPVDEMISIDDVMPVSDYLGLEYKDEEDVFKKRLDYVIIKKSHDIPVSHLEDKI